MGGEGRDRRDGSAAAPFRGETWAAVGDLHHRPLDGRTHRHGDPRAAAGGLSGRAAVVRTARWRSRLPDRRPVRHAGDVRSNLPGNDRIAVRGASRYRETGSTRRWLRIPSARRGSRSTRPDRESAHWCVDAVSHVGHRAQGAGRRRAVRQSQPHLRWIRGRCGAESNGQALRRQSGGPGLRPAIRHADRPHLRSDADDPARRRTRWFPAPT